ncbi:transposase [Burkholderia sp. BKH01]|nr:transposase [Burkholderia sp. BKH01]MCU9951927.1 transposase [Burkholderia sp. BKH01]
MTLAFTDIEAEQQLWNECAHLIANGIIHYNTALLSRAHEQKCATGDEVAMAFIASMSLVAWRHVNLFGVVDFGAATMPVDIDALVSYYADPEYWACMLQAAAEESDEETGDPAHKTSGSPLVGLGKPCQARAWVRFSVFGGWAKVANVAYTGQSEAR